MNPAREQASTRPKPYASLKNAPRSLPARRSLLALAGRKTNHVRKSTCHLETSLIAPVILARKGSALPWLVDDRACHGTLTRATIRRPIRLSAKASSASRVSPSNWSLEEAHLANTSLTEPNRGRGSTDRLNGVDSQAVSFLDGESGPTSPPGKTPTFIFGGRGDVEKGFLYIAFICLRSARRGPWSMKYKIRDAKQASAVWVAERKGSRSYSLQAELLTVQKLRYNWDERCRSGWDADEPPSPPPSPILY